MAKKLLPKRRRATTLSDFISAVRNSSPFHSNRVNDVSSRHVDVEEINDFHFRQIRNAAESCLAEGSSSGLMLLGGAGVGKSHLLIRLAHWADTRKATFAFLHNVLASPDRMPQQFLRYIISVLSRGTRDFKSTALYQLIKATARRAVSEAGLPKPTPKEFVSAFQQFASNLNLRQDAVHRQIAGALAALFLNSRDGADPFVGSGRHLLTITDWLSGGAVSEEALTEAQVDTAGMHRNDEGFIQLADGHELKQVILLLSELAAAVDVPFVICIDQMDNLDRDQVRSMSRFLHALLDDAHNLLIVTSGVAQTMLDFQAEGDIAEAAWDRLASTTVRLSRISVAEGREIILARLSQFFEPFDDLPDVRTLRQTHPFFPIAENEFEARYGDLLEVRPRDVISWARDGWQREQQELSRMSPKTWLGNWATDISWPDEKDDSTGKNGRKVGPETIRPRSELVDEAVRSRIRESIAQVRGQNGSLPPDADNLKQLLSKLLNFCANNAESRYDLSAVRQIPGKSPSYHLEVNHDGNLTGVCIVTSSDGRTTTPALKRLLNVSKTGLQRRILLTDEERLPLPMPSKGKELYAKLQGLGAGFVHLKLNLSLYAELDAIVSVVGDARSGDVEIRVGDGNYEPVTEQEVIASLHRQDAFSGHEILRGILSTDVELKSPPEPSRLDEQAIRVSIDGNLSWSPSMTTAELTEIFLAGGDHDITFDDAHGQFLTVARKMVEEELVTAMEYSGALLLIRA